MIAEEKMSIEINPDEVIILDKEEYDTLRRKANAFDILEADIRMKIDEGEDGYTLINDELILLLTGMKAYRMELRRKEAARNAERLKEAS